MKFSWKSFVEWVFFANLVTMAVNAVLYLVLALLTADWVGVAFSGFLSKVLLFETGLAFLIAGAVAYSGSASSSKAKEYLFKSDERWSLDKLRKQERHANRWIALAVALLAEAILLSLIGL